MARNQQTTISHSKRGRKTKWRSNSEKKKTKEAKTPAATKKRNDRTCRAIYRNVKYHGVSPGSSISSASGEASIWQEAHIEGHINDRLSYGIIIVNSTSPQARHRHASAAFRHLCSAPHGRIIAQTGEE